MRLIATLSHLFSGDLDDAFKRNWLQKKIGSMECRRFPLFSLKREIARVGTVKFPYPCSAILLLGHGVICTLVSLLMLARRPPDKTNFKEIVYQLSILSGSVL